MPRLHVTTSIVRSDAAFPLDAGAARHAQVLRLQPGHELTLFDGTGGEWRAEVVRMGRSDVEVRAIEHSAVEREAARAVHLVVGMPTNERMDWLVEKACELGAASIAPVVTERSVLRLAGERAEKKRAHWQAVAVAACEQCGRNRVPTVAAPQTWDVWLAATTPASGALHRIVLSLAGDAESSGAWIDRVLAPVPGGEVVVLSGPEGGLSPTEEAAARAAGFAAVTLGPRTLRAETAPLALLAALTLR